MSSSYIILLKSYFYFCWNGKSPVLKRWCGDEKAFTVITTSKEAYIEFMSNENNILGRGFRLSYRTVSEVSENDDQETGRNAFREERRKITSLLGWRQSFVHLSFLPELEFNPLKKKKKKKGLEK